MNIALAHPPATRLTPHRARVGTALRPAALLVEARSVAPGAGATSGHRTTCIRLAVARSPVLPSTPRRRFGRRLAAIALLSASALSACDDEAKVAVCDVRGEWVFRATLNDGGTEGPEARGVTLELRIDGELGSESVLVTNSVGNCGCNAPTLVVDRDRCTFQLTFWNGGEIDGECSAVSSRFELSGSASDSPGSSSGSLYEEFDLNCDPPDHPDQVTYMTGGRR
jgi:hypothetical protein